MPRCFEQQTTSHLANLQLETFNLQLTGTKRSLRLASFDLFWRNWAIIS
jgi:hypothetical protein